MSDSLTLETAELVALFVNSLLFGAFTVLYIITSWTLLSQQDGRPRRQRQHLAVFAASSCLWALSIAYSGLTVHRALVAYAGRTSSIPGSVLLYYADIGSAAVVAKDAIYVTTVLIADSFLTYRLYVVWDHAWGITVLPILLVVGTAGAGYGACGDLATISASQSPILSGPSTLTPFIGTLFSLPVATNLLLTVLIAGRIASSFFRTRKHDVFVVSSWHWEVLETVIESALISSTGLAALLGTFAARSNAQYICMDAVQPLIGINFTLIILRAHYRRSSQDRTHSDPDVAIGYGPTSIGVQLRGSRRISQSAMRFDVSVSDSTFQGELSSKA